MSKKVVFVGPQEVGKSTLRKWIFEGESLFKLLENPLEPTYGYENFSYNLLKNIGVFDLAGQEKERWFTEEKSIFNDSDIILNILDAREKFSEIRNYIQEALNVQLTQAKKSTIFFLIHKIDLIDKVELEKLKNHLKLFKKDLKTQDNLNLKIYYTSIKPDYVYNTLSAFIDLFQEAGLDKEGELDTKLLQLNVNLFHNLLKQKVISLSRLTNVLQSSKSNLQTLISSYEESGLIRTKKMDRKNLIYLTEKGEQYYEQVLKSFNELNQASVETSTKSTTLLEKPEIKEIPAKALIYGILISDENGKTLISVETEEGSLKEALNRANNPQFDLELIPMFLNAMSKFAEEINVKDLSSFRVQGGNLKMSSLSRKNLTMTLFTHPEMKIEYIKDEFSTLFDFFLEEYHEYLDFFAKTGNATKFLDFIPQANREIKKIVQKYKKIKKEMESFNIDDAKKLYAKLNETNEANLPLEDQLHVKSLKVQLLEGILADDMQTITRIEQDIRKYV